MLALADPSSLFRGLKPDALVDHSGGPEDLADPSSLFRGLKLGNSGDFGVRLSHSRGPLLVIQRTETRIAFSSD